MGIQRRRFLKGMAGAASLLAARQSFAASLSELSLPGLEEDSFADLRRQYLLLPEITYFNHGSIGTIPALVSRAHQRYLEVCEANPWLYMWGGAWEEAREEVRRKSSRVLGCRPEECAITHNTTEGFNILAAGLPLGAGDEVLFSSLNHSGASICWSEFGSRRGFSVKRFEFPIGEIAGMSGADLIAIYASHISDRTKVLVFPHVDNVVGFRYPVKELTETARRKGVTFIAVDGAQSLGMIPTDMESLGIDFYAASPHKWLQAPKGLGLLYVRSEVQQQLPPLWVTWGQERWKDSARRYEDYGTRNLAAVVAMGDAIDFQNQIQPAARQARLQKLRDHFRRRTSESSNLKWISPERWELSSSVYSAEVLGRDSREVSETMYKRWGCVVRPFHGDDLNMLRLSPNVMNTEHEIDLFFSRFEMLGR